MISIAFKLINLNKTVINLAYPEVSSYFNYFDNRELQLINSMKTVMDHIYYMLTLILCLVNVA